MTNQFSGFVGEKSCCWLCKDVVMYDFHTKVSVNPKVPWPSIYI